MSRTRRPRRSAAFAYRLKMWHPQKMEPQTCQHNVHCSDQQGFLQGSWTTEKTQDGTRVVCDSCGKFYGYLQAGTLPPIKRPVSLLSASGPAKQTGSSSCTVVNDSARPGQGTAAASLPGPFHQKRSARRPIDYAALRQLVSISQVLQVIEFAPTGRSGVQVRGPCPIHKSTRPRSRIFSANLDRNIYQCFKASCGSKGNQLDLYAAVTGLPLYEAATQLCNKLHLDVPWKEPRRCLPQSEPPSHS